jgi:hypothetical protein
MYEFIIRKVVRCGYTPGMALSSYPEWRCSSSGLLLQNGP